MAEAKKGYGKMHLEGPNGAIAITAEHLARATSIGELFEKAQRTAIAFMNMSYGIYEITDELDKFTNPEDGKGATTITHIQSAIELHDFGNVKPESDEYHTLLQAVAFKEGIVRQLIRSTVAGENNLGLTDTERIFLEKGTLIQDAFDRLHLHWRKEVLDGEGFTELRRLQKIYEETCIQAGKSDDQIDHQYAYKHFFHDAIGPHGDFLYVMPGINENNEIVGIPYAVAFKNEIFGKDGQKGIVELIEDMDLALQPFEERDPNAHGLIATNEALKALLTCEKSPAEQEKLAEQLDRDWLIEAPAIGPNANTLRILYPMETYFDPGKMLVEFEYNIMFVDNRDEYNKLNQRITDGKAAALAFFDDEENEKFNRFTTLKKSLSVMDKCHATFYSMLRSGTSLGFKSAASNVPNRPKVRLISTIIDMDYSTFVERSEIAHGHMEKIFDDDQMKRYFSGQDTELEMTTLFVGLHEIGHNAFVVEDTITRLTSPINADLEEAKSDIFAVVGALSYLQGEEREEYVAALFAASIRGITRWQEYEDRTHFYGDAMRLQLMLDTGIVREENGKWIFEPNEDNIKDFWERSINILVEFGDVYESRNPEMAQALMAKYYTESDKLKRLAQKAGINTSPPKAKAA